MTKEQHQNLINLVKLLPLPIRIALTVFGEARGESEQGKIAVAWVCLNRERNINQFDDILDPYQFSCWNYGDPNFDTILALLPFNQIYAECLDIAYGVYFGKLPDPTGGATNYYAPKLMTMIDPTSGGKPTWAKDMQTTKIIGDHVFLKG